MAVLRYYCPGSIPRPGHIRVQAGVRLLDGAGIDGRGGMCYGGPFDADLPWEPTPDGWYLCLVDVAPRDLRRANAIRGPLIDGWLVPQLLSGEAPIVGYFDAAGFQVPEPLAGLVTQMQALLDYVGPVTKAMADLAAALLGINHHACLVELGAMRVLTPPRVRMILDAATIGAPQALLEEAARTMPAVAPPVGEG